MVSSYGSSFAFFSLLQSGDASYNLRLHKTVVSLYCEMLNVRDKRQSYKLRCERKTMEESKTNVTEREREKRDNELC